MNWKNLFKRAGGGVTIIQPPPPPPPPPPPTPSVGRPYFDYYIYKDGDQIVAEYRDGTKVATSTDFAQVLTAVDQHATQVYGNTYGTPISIMMDRGLYELQTNLDISTTPFTYYIYGVGTIPAYVLARVYGDGSSGGALARLYAFMNQLGRQVKLPQLGRIKLASEQPGESAGQPPSTPNLGKYVAVIRTNGHYLRLGYSYTIMYNIGIIIDGSYTSDTLATDLHSYPPEYRSPLQLRNLQMYYTSIYAPFTTDTLDTKTVTVIDGDYISAYYSTIIAVPTVPSDHNVYVLGNRISIIHMADTLVSASLDIGNLYMFTGSGIYLKDLTTYASAPYARLYSSCRGRVDIDGGDILMSSYNEILNVPVIEFTCPPSVDTSVNIIRPIGMYGWYTMPIVRITGNEVPVNNTPYRVNGVTTITGDGSTTTFSLGQHNISSIFGGIYAGAECPDTIRVTCSSTLPVRCYLSSDMQTVYAQFDTPPPAGQQVAVVWEAAYVKYCRPKQTG